MYTLNNRIQRTAIAFALAAGLALGAAAPTFAQDGSTATVTGGSLAITLPAAGDFTASITGVAQTPTAALATFSVSDLRGSGAGWHVTAQASQFTVAGVGGKTLAAGSLTMSAPSVLSPDTTSADPTGLVGGVIDSASALTIASAALNTGMGEYDFSATTLSLALPADVFAGAYASTVTISAITAP